MSRGHGRRHRPPQHDPGDRRAARRRVGAARRRRPVLDAGRARPARLRLDRSVRGARRGGRRDGAHRPRDDDRHRPVAQRRAAGQAGGVGRRAVGQTPHAGPRRRRAARRLRDGAGRPPRPRPAPLRAARRPERRRRPRGPTRPAAPGRRHGRPRLRAHGALRRRLRAQRRPAARVRPRRGQCARSVERPRPPGTPAALGSGLLRARRRGPGRRLPARLLRLHRPVRGADRRRQPHLGPRDPRLRARLRGGRLRRADPVPDGRRPRRSSTAWPRCWREGPHHRRRPGRPLPGDPAQEGRPHPRRHGRRAQPTRRDVRLGRRVLRGDAGRAARRRPREPPRRSPTRSRAGRRSTSTTAGGCCARAATRSRPSRASCSSRSSSAARASSASTFASRPR